MLSMRIRARKTGGGMKEKIILSLVAFSALAAKPGSAQPAIFNPDIEKNCILSWFEMTPDNTTDDLAVAYNNTEPLRLEKSNACGKPRKLHPHVARH